MWLYNHALNFFGIDGLLYLVQSHVITLPYIKSRLGLGAVISTIFPALLVVEIIALCALNAKDAKSIYRHYKVPFLSHAANMLLGTSVVMAVFLWCTDIFARHSLFTLPFTWYGFLLGYVIWEFSHFAFHYSCHKVRVLWCLHSPHHAPKQMNLSVIFTAFFLHGAYATVIRTSICILLGIPLPMLLFIMILDSCWGSLIHVSESIMPVGKMWFLRYVILTPSHHRVHHASNPEYIDKNFCNTLNVWDIVFRTYQPQIDGVKLVYGITREMNANSFFDSYFGEIVLLAKDIRRASTARDRVLLLLMPPGWTPKGTSTKSAPV